MSFHFWVLPYCENQLGLNLKVGGKRRSVGCFRSICSRTFFYLATRRPWDWSTKGHHIYLSARAALFLSNSKGFEWWWIRRKAILRKSQTAIELLFLTAPSPHCSLGSFPFSWSEARPGEVVNSLWSARSVKVFECWIQRCLLQLLPLLPQPPPQSRMTAAAMWLKDLVSRLSSSTSRPMVIPRSMQHANLRWQVWWNPAQLSSSWWSHWQRQAAPSPLNTLCAPLATQRTRLLEAFMTRVNFLHPFLHYCSFSRGAFFHFHFSSCLPF